MAKFYPVKKSCLEAEPLLYSQLMPIPLQKFREAVFQILYSLDYQTEAEEMVPFMMQELQASRKAMQEARGRAQSVLEKRDEIDSRITSASTEYSFERISRVEKNVLRLGLFELLFDPLIPPKVAIAEAIRLCRKFGTPESAQFVNAILDGIYQNLPHATTNQPQPV